ncbi:MAG: 50S ribosomal protein L25 [Candidatus Moranbacteria bacterium]|nr:50S ribosomal protein L25 [Candidatus Moranbacteria bacterium]
MSKKIVLNAEKREETGRPMRKLVGERIPAIVYGVGMESNVVWVDKNDFIQVFGEAGKNTVVELKIGKEKALNVLIHDFQAEPVSDEIRHVDFLQVNMNEATEAEVPLVFVGESPAVKEKGGTLVKSFDHVVVEALPDDLPSEIEVDLSKIVDFEDHIVVSDIKVGDKVKLLLDEKNTIASVTPPRTDAEMESLDEEVDADVSKVEGAAEDVPEGDENGEKKEEKK